jgi:hypothetical protein
MVYRYVRYNGHGLIIRVNFMVKCVCVGFGSNGFMTKTQPFLMDGHHRTNIISGVGHPRSDFVVLLVLCTVVMQWLGFRHCTTGPLGQCQPYREWLISRVDHTIKLLLLLMIISLYIYITSMINCHLIMLHVLYKQLSLPFNDGYVMCIYIHKVVGLTPVLFTFFLHMYNYTVIDSLTEDGYYEASGYVGGFDWGDA